MRIKRVICCLVLIVASLFGLTACGSDKNVATIQNKYSSIKTANPDLFVVSENIDGENITDTTDVMFITYNKDNEMSKLKELTDLNMETMGFANDQNLYKRYYALYYIQQQLLTDIFSYYEEQSDNFYKNYDIAGVGQDDLNTFYKKLENFANAVKEFSIKKKQLEETVDVMTFTGVVRADLTSYAYSLNMLIEESLDLIGYFKDINTKYFYSGEMTEENQVEYIRHYLCEANFQLAEICYYKYLKAFNNINECDLSSLISVNSAKQAIIIKSEIWNGFRDVKNIDRTFNKLDSKLNQDEIDDFIEVRASFMQKTEIYKTVYNSMNYYQFNKEYIANTLNKYKSSIGAVEKANIKLIELYYDTTLTDYVNAVKGLKAE